MIEAQVANVQSAWMSGIIGDVSEGTFKMDTLRLHAPARQLPDARLKTCLCQMSCVLGCLTAILSQLVQL